ncbi:hypothetical protein GPECTOR_2g1198 [Gonium pectorale]|uniref:Uncharacterized protein n=1 Tax=Gonium pectorale TaxID=33097 RepID=A0A150H1A9_GONPE|nr:hypothetical protein GPECTOR_2g1198 [Gonium pectorale]|eukprot:KXZ55648.1 hypothetical protein GPECTOR_2g1198 [Gonium pectorale]
MLSPMLVAIVALLRWVAPAESACVENGSSAAVDSYLGQCMNLTAEPLRPVNILVMNQARGYGAELLAEAMEAQTGFQANLSFVDIPLVATVYDGHVIGVPFTGQISVLYYRKDILAAAKQPVPATWEQLLTVARNINGTDFNGDGIGDYAICWQVDNCLEAPVILSQIVAPYIQYEGTMQGWLFEPEDMKLLLNSTAMSKALELLRALNAVAAPMSQCELFHFPFINGTCAFSIKWSEQFKATEFLPGPAKGNVGVAQLPGSTHVLNRTTGQLVPCTNQTCKHAKWELDPFTGQHVLINRAPHFGFGGFAGSVRKAADPGYQRAVYRYFANLAGVQLSFQMMITFGTLIGPFRTSHLSLANLPRAILNAAAMNASLTTMPVKTIVVEVAQQMQAVLQSSGTVEEVRSAYNTALGRSSSSYPPEPASPPARPGRQPDETEGAGSQLQAYMPLAFVLLMAMLLVSVYVGWAHHQGRTLLGAPRAPGPGPETTLLVATLPDLPYLLRDLPDPLIERKTRTVGVEACKAAAPYLLTPATALRLPPAGAAPGAASTGAAASDAGLHGAPASAAAPPEQQWALLAAFRNPRDAVAFAAAATSELLQLDWPPLLLLHPACAPLYAVPVNVLPEEVQDEPSPARRAPHPNPLYDREPAPKGRGPRSPFLTEVARQHACAGAASGAAAVIDSAMMAVGAHDRDRDRDRLVGKGPEAATAAQTQPTPSRQAPDPLYRRSVTKEASSIARSLMSRRRVFALGRSDTRESSLSGLSDQDPSVGATWTCLFQA